MHPNVTMRRRKGPTTVSRTCLFCGRTFESTPTQVRHGGGKYCTHKCSSDHHAATGAQRFWAKTRSHGDCVLWTGAASAPFGYGRTNYYGQKWWAHRLAWVLTHGPIPSGLWVLHNCPGGDTPLCVNPAHLWLGTAADNNRDMAAKGRAASGTRNGTHMHPDRVLRGEQQPNARLTEAQVREMRALHRPHSHSVGSPKQLAQQYGVSIRTVSAILYRKSWRHI